MDPSPRVTNTFRADAEQQAREFVEATGLKDSKYRLIMRSGMIADVLARVIASEEIDLVVLGTHGSGGIGKLVLGSVAEEMLRRVPCPVLTVGKPAVPAGAFQRILFATDFGPGAARALPVALDLAQTYRAQFILLHMLTPIPVLTAGAMTGMQAYLVEDTADWQARKKQESVRKLLELIPREMKLMSEPEYIVGNASAPEGILSAAAERQADLIVMGAHRSTVPRAVAHLPWTVVHRVICEAKCPVLTVAG